ncbi:nucleoside hydrolase [Lactobacillus corticis]|uniref:Nucleoside hydrolase n=1 Tax=Lactobacillus corticis TaxID=2201249 RepID=A0A916VIS6_9LACO|nr:nucleoside hydrolase [Lactobacillus corticis]GFZ26264.1 nucleoside hydrolase [Lactobacillus corticis]
MNPKPLIISTDPGIDDAAAITLALFNPQLDVKLLVPTWGNVSLPKTLNNTLRLLTFLHKKVPVVAGASRPLLRPAIDASSVHGESGMAGYDFPEADSSNLISGLAAERIHEVVAVSSEPVELMQIGPATDFALYFRQYPQDLAKISQLTIMGGAIGRGNWGPYAEYNVAGDPEAAQIVFDSHLKVQVAPLELGHQAYLDQASLAAIKASGPIGEMLYGIMTNIHDILPSKGIESYDALACGMLLESDMYTFKPAMVKIETAPGYAYGASIIDFDNFFDQPANAMIGTAIDRQRFSDWFIAQVRAADALS